jgi:hypothetical protein
MRMPISETAKVSSAFSLLFSFQPSCAKTSCKGTQSVLIPRAHIVLFPSLKSHKGFSRTRYGLDGNKEEKYLAFFGTAF